MTNSLDGMLAAVIKEKLEEIVNAKFDAMEKRILDAIGTKDDTQEVDNLERRELCARWHISPATLNNRIKAGVIKPIHIGGGRRVVFKISDVLKAEGGHVGIYGRPVKK